MPRVAYSGLLCTSHLLHSFSFPAVLKCGHCPFYLFTLLRPVMMLVDFHIFQSLPSMPRSSQLLSHFLCRSLLLVAKNTPVSFSNCSFLPRQKTVILSLGDSYISFENKDLSATAQPNFRSGFCTLVPTCAFSTLSRAVLLSSRCLRGLRPPLRTESVI